MEDPIDFGEPKIVIERTGKYWFKVSIQDNWCNMTRDWHRLGYERAYKKGRKELKKVKKKEAYKKETVIIK
jgi:hypothetical protein